MIQLECNLAFFSELSLSTKACSSRIFELTNFAYASETILVILATTLIIILVNRYKTARALLEEKNHALNMIENQNVVLKQKEKDITDSLIYAQRIQEARLPSEKYFRKHFPSSFIFLKPRDIVSGDFYLIGEKKQWIYIIAADCTGHGISGALMSMIGMEIIEKAMNECDITKPSKILSYIDESLEKIFSHEKSRGDVIMDGMDVGVCAINKQERKIIYSGALFPMYIISDNSLTQIKADKVIIGMNPDRLSYTDHEINIKENDVLYLFSDGYADQFGGAENKKFMYRRFRYLLLNIHKFNAEDQKLILEENLENWMGDSPQVDDIMVIGFKPL